MESLPRIKRGENKIAVFEIFLFCLLRNGVFEMFVEKYVWCVDQATVQLVKSDNKDNIDEDCEGHYSKGLELLFHLVFFFLPLMLMKLALSSKC